MKAGHSPTVHLLLLALLHGSLTQLADASTIFPASVLRTCVHKMHSRGMPSSTPSESSSRGSSRDESLYWLLNSADDDDIDGVEASWEEGHIDDDEAAAGPWSREATELVYRRRKGEKSDPTLRLTQGMSMRGLRQRVDRSPAAAAAAAARAGVVAPPRDRHMEEVDMANEAALEHVMEVVGSDGWEPVAKTDGVTVVKKRAKRGGRGGGDEEKALELMVRGGGSGDALDGGMAIGGTDYSGLDSGIVANGDEGSSTSVGGASRGVVDPAKAAKFDIIMAYGTLNARAEDLFELFKGNDRVQEYNDNCKEVRDLHVYDEKTKISWACTPRYGPFKARDFVTVVNYQRLEDGTLVVVNRPVDHPAAPRGSKKYQRAEILIASNIMRPNPHDSSKTDFTVISHINPGGIVDNKLGAKIANKLSASAPVALLKALEAAANRAPPSTPQP